MKKYLLLGFVVLALGVLGARVWYVHSACHGEVRPADMVEWIEQPQNAVFEVSNNSFYVQEAIGSQGVVLAYPRKLRGNFNLGFELLSLTEEAEISLKVHKENDMYESKMIFSATENRLRFYKNKTLILEKETAIIQPNVFYNFSIRREGKTFYFAVDKQELLKAEVDDLPVVFRMQIKGRPDNPAAIEIMSFSHGARSAVN